MTNVSQQVYRSLPLGLYNSGSDGNLSTSHMNTTELAWIEIGFDPHSTSVMVVRSLPNSSAPGGHHLDGFTWNWSTHSVADRISMPFYVQQQFLSWLGKTQAREHLYSSTWFLEPFPQGATVVAST